MKRRDSLFIVSAVITTACLVAGKPVHAQDMFAISYGTAPGQVYRITPAGVASLLTTIPGSTGFSDIKLNPAGELLISDTGTNNIYQVNPNTGVSSVFASLPGSPRGKTYDGSGNLVVATLFNNTLSKISPSGVVTTFVTSGLLSGPADIVRASSGDYFVLNGFSNSVVRVTAAGAVSSFVSGGGLNAPRGLAIDNANNLFVSNGDGSISKITSGGTISTFAAAGSADGAFGLVMDSSSNLYVGDWTSGQIKKITPGGAISNYSSSGVAMTNPSGLAFASASASAPEPASLSLLALGSLGALVKRRRQGSRASL